MYCYVLFHDTIVFFLLKHASNKNLSTQLLTRNLHLFPTLNSFCGEKVRTMMMPSRILDLEFLSLTRRLMTNPCHCPSVRDDASPWNPLLEAEDILEICWTLSSHRFKINYLICHGMNITSLAPEM